MSSKSSNKRLKKEMAYLTGCRIPDFVNYLFLTVMFGIFPIVMDNKYFNITITRYHFYIYSAGIYIVLMIIAYIVENILEPYYEGIPLIQMHDQGRWYTRPDFWMEAFLMANVFAWLVSVNKSDALSGKSGRFMGLLFFIIVAMMFVIMVMRVRLSMIIFMVLAASSAFAYIVAIFQHAGNDFMNYKENISPKQYDIFISTLGNINIFASFLTITIAVFLAMFVFAEKPWYRIIAGILLIGGGFVMMIANSDSAYLGTGVSAVLIFFLAYNDGYVQRYIGALFLLALGNLGVVLQNKYIIKEYDKRGGVAEALDRVDLAVAILVAIAVIYIIVYAASVILKDKLDLLNKKRIITALLCIMAVGIVCIVMVGIKSGSALFTFNYKWGTYRGYIWTKCAELYGDAPLVNKLFGYGNESLKSLMNSNYHKEMLAITGKVYDNAHNEVLQYLVTTGIVGALSYVGLFVSSFVYILKNSAGKPIAYISLAVITGYFAQGLINLNQPITTPFYFLFMAMGIGYIRYQKRVSEYNE